MTHDHDSSYGESVFDHERYDAAPRPVARLTVAMIALFGVCLTILLFIGAVMLMELTR